MHVPLSRIFFFQKFTIRSFAQFLICKIFALVCGDHTHLIWVGGLDRMAGQPRGAWAAGGVGCGGMAWVLAGAARGGAGDVRA